MRSTLGLGAGAARELGELAIPRSVRRSQLYQNLVDTTLRYLIEQVGGAEGVLPRRRSKWRELPDAPYRRQRDRSARHRGVSRVAGMGPRGTRRSLRHGPVSDTPEIAQALKAEGLLDEDTQFASVDHLLDGLERTSARLAATVNTPPLDVPSLRREWQAIREEARSIPPGKLPSREDISAVWAQLKQESARHNRSVFETSSILAVSAVQRLPQGIKWPATSATLGASRTGQVFATALLNDYRQTLDEIRQVGFVTYAARQFTPYVRAAVRQFSPGTTHR